MRFRSYGSVLRVEFYSINSILYENKCSDCVCEINIFGVEKV